MRRRETPLPRRQRGVGGEGPIIPAMATYENILVDRVGTDGRVARVTLNRPEKMNSLSQELLFEWNDALHELEADDSARVIIVRGAGRTFSAGYDLAPARGGADAVVRRYKTVDESGRRLLMGIRTGMQQITDIHMYFWNMAKVTIAQVHGYCLAGGSELATGCDVVYMAEDAKMGYPAVRFGVPDMQFHAWLVGMRRGMEMMLTGDPIDGIEAAQRGWATRAYPADQLEAKTLEMAQRIASLPPDIVALNKRAVHRQMEVMGLRQGIRQGTEICAMAIHQKSFGDFISQTGAGKGKLTAALQKRDSKFGDYRTGHAAAGKSGKNAGKSGSGAKSAKKK